VGAVVEPNDPAGAVRFDVTLRDRRIADRHDPPEFRGRHAEQMAGGKADAAAVRDGDDGAAVAACRQVRDGTADADHRLFVALAAFPSFDALDAPAAPQFRILGFELVA
jgi:hypothetical protein